MTKDATLVIEDRTDEILRVIKKFRRDVVLVGIPEQDTNREQEPGEEPTHMTNAALLAQNQFGSPALNIPARPVMTIGLRNAQKDIADLFKQAMLSAFKSGVSALSVYYNRVGIIASVSVKKVINDQEGIKGPAESTLRSRGWVTIVEDGKDKIVRMKSRKRRGGTKALIVTGQMRNAITYVVKGEE